MDKKAIKAALKHMEEKYDKISFLDEFKEKMGYEYHDEFSMDAFGKERTSFWRLKKGKPSRKSPLYIMERDGYYALFSISNEQHTEWIKI